MKPAILLVGSFLSSAGENPAVGEGLALRLRAAGWNVITTSDKRPRLARLLDMLSSVWKRRKIYQIAYVEVYSGPAFIWAEAVCSVLRLIQKPYVLALHGGNLPDFARRWPGRVKRLLQLANEVVAPSRYLLEGMKPYREDVELIPNPLDLAQYPCRTRAAPQPRLIWLRAFHEIYNPRMAVRVVAELREQFPDISLTMIGPDKGDGSLQAAQSLAESLNVAAHVRFIGGIPKSEVPGWLDQADIFINTSNIDNTPVSILEAMACGLCIVSTNVGGIPFLLDDRGDALLVPVDDHEALAEAVTRILSEPVLSGCLSGNARAKVDNFDWSVVTPQWESLFRRITGKRWDLPG